MTQKQQRLATQVVPLVGRMNVGKSTLFNRIALHARSMVFDYPGVTRDIIRDLAEWGGKSFEIVDTGGISLRATDDPFQGEVRRKALEIVSEAAVVIQVVDGTVGVLPEDQEIARLMHKMGKTLIIAVNKSDHAIVVEHMGEMSRLGGVDTIMISAHHGRGIDELLDAVTSRLPHASAEESERPAIRLMLLGKPNVGKSSLMNALMGYERSIVSPVAGTTREAVAEKITFYRETVLITDTPGVRRKRAVAGELEPLMVDQSFGTLFKTQIVLLVVDGTDGAIADQELKLAFYAFQEQYKALIIIVNKSDLMTEEHRAALDHSLEPYAHLMDKVPIRFVSALTGKNVGTVLPLVKEVHARYVQKLPDAQIKRLLIDALKEKPLMRAQYQLHVYGAKQIATGPITIELAVNEVRWFQYSPCAFLERILRAEYDLIGVPIKWVVTKAR